MAVNMSANRRRVAKIFDKSLWAHPTSLRSFWKKTLLGVPIGVIRTRRWRTDVTQAMRGVDPEPDCARWVVPRAMRQVNR